MKVSLEILLPYTPRFWLGMYQLTSRKIDMLLLSISEVVGDQQVVKNALNSSHT